VHVQVGGIHIVNCARNCRLGRDTHARYDAAAGSSSSRLRRRRRRSNNSSSSSSANNQAITDDAQQYTAHPVPQARCELSTANMEGYTCSCSPGFDVQHIENARNSCMLIAPGIARITWWVIGSVVATALSLLAVPIVL
jgi:hypothetical protein